MSKLTLITTETFNNLPCNFYRNMNDDILLTREQIGQALEYSYPDDALSKIHKRHSDRLDSLSVVVKLASTDGKMYDTTLYSERGIMEICRWSNKPKANEFMDWTWDIIEKYRHNKLTTTPNIQPLIDAITALTQTVTTMQQDISSLKETSEKKKILPKKYSRWKTNTFEKLTTLMDFANTHSDQNLTLPSTIHLTLEELQDTYDIEFNDYVEAYKSEYGLDNTPYTIDVIDHYKDIRKLYTSILDNRLEQLNLVSCTEPKKNIFDILAENMQN